jgi:hypothetical protein
MWSDREDLSDPASYLRRLRETRHAPDRPQARKRPNVRKPG